MELLHKEQTAQGADSSATEEDEKVAEICFQKRKRLCDSELYLSFRKKESRQITKMILMLEFRGRNLHFGVLRDAIDTGVSNS